MAGTPMQFPQCAMPPTTPAKRERLSCYAPGQAIRTLTIWPPWRIVRSMSTEVIEQKLAELSRRLEDLEARRDAKPAAKDSWRDAVGAMKDCDLFDEAMRRGAEWRAKANAEGR